MNLYSEDQAFRIHEKVSLAAADLLASVVPSLFAAYSARLGRLRIDYPSARLGVSTQSRSQALAQRRVEPLEGAIDAPLPEPMVDGLPRREVAGQKPPGASAFEQVVEDAFKILRGLCIFGRPRPRFVGAGRQGLRWAHSASDRSVG